MILQTLQSANSVIMDSVNNTRNKMAVKDFKNQIISLNGCITQLEQLLNLIQAFEEKGFGERIISKDIKKSLQEAVDSCGEKTYDHSLDVNTVTALKNAVELCRNSLVNAWKGIADERCGSVIESLASLKGLLGNKKEVDELLTYLTKAKANMPASSRALDVFAANVEKGKRIVDGLDFTSNPQIKVFIDKVRLQKATVGDLTPTVLEWLNKNHLTDKIMLRFQTWSR